MHTLPGLTVACDKVEDKVEKTYWLLRTYSLQEEIAITNTSEDMYTITDISLYMAQRNKLKESYIGVWISCTLNWGLDCKSNNLQFCSFYACTFLTHYGHAINHIHSANPFCVFVCVCVWACVWERERETVSVHQLLTFSFGRKCWWTKARTHSITLW